MYDTVKSIRADSFDLSLEMFLNTGYVVTYVDYKKIGVDGQPHVRINHFWDYGTADMLFNKFLSLQEK